MVIMMLIVVVVLEVMMYIKKEWNPCWFHSQTHIQITTVSRYMIAGLLQVLPTHLLTTLSTNYCPNENVNNIGLRKPFYFS